MPLRKQVLEYLHLKDQKVSDKNINEEKLTHLKKLYVDQQSALLSSQNSLSVLEEERESFQNNILVWSEQEKSAGLNIQRLKNEIS